MEQMWSRSAMRELPLGSTMVRVADMKQLEEASPLLLETDTPLGRYEMENLPAILAAPMDEIMLLDRLPDQELAYRMWRNPRYRRFFERNIRQDADRIRPELTPEWRKLLDKFVEAITSTEKIDWRQQTAYLRQIIPKNDKIPVLDKFQIEELKDILSVLASPTCVTILRQLTEESLSIGALVSRIQKSQSWISRLLGRMRKMTLVESPGKTGGRAAKFASTKKGLAVLRWGSN